MPGVTIVFGVVLIALGVGGYVATGMVSVTALIPAFFGVVIALLGALALRPRLRKHAMHVVVLVSLLGFLGAARGLLKLPQLLSDASQLERPAAVVSQSIMAVLCLIFVALAIGSFVKARGGGKTDLPA